MIFSSASFHKIEVVNTINYANTCKVKLCTVLNPCNCVVGLHMYYITQELYNVSVITFSTALKSVFWGDVVLFFVRAILDLWSFKLTCGLHVSFMSWIQVYVFINLAILCTYVIAGKAHYGIGFFIPWKVKMCHL